MKKNILLVSPALIILLAFAVIPLFIVIYFSFITDAQPVKFTLEHIVRFFTKTLYLKLTFKTIKMSVIVTLISLIIGYPAAYVIAKIVRKGKALLLLFIIIPFWSSQLVRAYSWLNLLREGGLMESFLKSLHLIGDEGLQILFTQTAVIIALVHIFCPYMVITCYMSLEKIEDSILDASTNLGANFFDTFRKITLPLSMPGIITGCILIFVPCLGSFVEPRILGGVNGSVIGTVIQDQFFEIYGWNFGSAISLVLLILVFLSMGLLSALRGGRGNA